VRRQRAAGAAVGGIAVLGGLTLALAGCGLPTDSAYKPLDAGALEQTTTTTTTTTTIAPRPTTTVVPTTTTTSPPSETVVVYLVNGNGQLQPVKRQATIPSSPKQALDLLQQGVQPGDAAGLRSAIPAGALVDVQVVGGKATVSLTPPGPEPAGIEQVLEFAQIVLTLTDQRGIGQVEFKWPGPDNLDAIRNVPKGTGELVAQVSRDDYKDLVAPA
jgi:hypothetical protein